MNASANSKKRIEKDVMKLIMSEYEVTLKDESRMNEFSVIMSGPKNSPYEDGVWVIDVLLPDQYPYKSPSIGFVNKIYHPNIDEASGSVCLDVINQTWSPMYELKNIFDVFLPQLLAYPNPSDPLNSKAAKLLLNDSTKFEEIVREHVKKHAYKHISKEKGKAEKKLISDKKQDRKKESTENEESNNEDNLSELSEASENELSEI